jgi:hypothetical protein
MLNKPGTYLSILAYYYYYYYYYYHHHHHLERPILVAARSKA